MTADAHTLKTANALAHTKQMNKNWQTEGNTNGHTLALGGKSPLFNSFSHIYWENLSGSRYNKNIIQKQLKRYNAYLVTEQLLFKTSDSEENVAQMSLYSPSYNGYNAYGLYMTWNSNVTIENSDFSHNEGDSGYGTWMAFCSAITFENCQAQHNTGSYDPSMRTLFCTQVLSQYELLIILSQLRIFHFESKSTSCMKLK